MRSKPRVVRESEGGENTQLCIGRLVYCETRVDRDDEEIHAPRKIHWLPALRKTPPVFRPLPSWHFRAINKVSVFGFSLRWNSNSKKWLSHLAINTARDDKRPESLWTESQHALTSLWNLTPCNRLDRVNTAETRITGPFEITACYFTFVGELLEGHPRSLLCVEKVMWNVFISLNLYNTHSLELKSYLVSLGDTRVYYKHYRNIQKRKTTLKLFRLKRFLEPAIWTNVLNGTIP